VRPKLFFLDARLAFPLGLWLLHWSWWTFALAAASFLIFLVLELMGVPPDAALLAARARLVGPVRPATEVSVLRRRCRY
jgi:intracellular multiplication protein IcmT